MPTGAFLLWKSIINNVHCINQTKFEFKPDLSGHKEKQQDGHGRMNSLEKLLNRYEWIPRKYLVLHEIIVCFKVSVTKNRMQQHQSYPFSPPLIPTKENIPKLRFIFRELITRCCGVVSEQSTEVNHLNTHEDDYIFPQGDLSGFCDRKCWSVRNIIIQERA